jgi:hypothetical protein
MILGTFILLLTGLALAMYATLWVFVPAGARDWRTDETAALGTALLLVLLLLSAIVLRNIDFNLDARTYLELFQTWCEFGYAGREGFTFTASMVALNSAMFGACDPALLKLAWAAIMVAVLALVPAPIQTRILFMGVFAFSMPGIEMLTNAMRQGFALVLIVVALAIRKNNYKFSIFFIIFSAVFHLSSILFLATYSVSALRWRYYLFTILGIAGIVYFLSDPPKFILSEFPLLNYVAIYARLKVDDLLPRILVLTNIVLLAALPILADRGIVLNWRVFFESEQASVIRLSFMGIAASALPGFGYRFGYGVIAIILWVLLEDRSKAAARFPYILLANLTVLLLWAFGSTYMRTVPFL